jgi:hypothetical protein
MARHNIKMAIAHGSEYVEAHGQSRTIATSRARDSKVSVTESLAEATFPWEIYFGHVAFRGSKSRRDALDNSSSTVRATPGRLSGLSVSIANRHSMAVLLGVGGPSARLLGGVRPGQYNYAQQAKIMRVISHGQSNLRVPFKELEQGNQKRNRVHLLRSIVHIFENDWGMGPPPMVPHTPPDRCLIIRTQPGSIVCLPAYDRRCLSHHLGSSALPHMRPQAQIVSVTGNAAPFEMRPKYGRIFAQALVKATQAAR